MNKKLIAIAVASVMAAPVAMADIKISGRVAQDLTINTEDTPGSNDTRGLSDSGHARIQFDGTAGDAYARIAYNDANQGRDKMRDQYVGYKFGGGMSVQAGTMAIAAKNLEKDAYIATFLETRDTVANSATHKTFSSNGFVTDLVQFKMKAGAANITVQYGVAEYRDTNNGHIGVGVSGSAGPVAYYASYNNGSADGDSTAATYPSQSNIKAGASMKFGMAKIGLMYTSMDTDGAPATAGVATDSILVDANFDLGNGLSANAAVATRSGNVAADDATFMRIAVMKKLNKSASVYAGYTATDFDATSATADLTELGAGMLVKF